MMLLTKPTFIILCLTLTLLIVISTTLAQTGDRYDLSWSSLDGGGGADSGSAYTLNGTIGQPDAGQLSGGSYNLAGGFWYAPADPLPEEMIYLPLVIKN